MASAAQPPGDADNRGPSQFQASNCIILVVEDDPPLARLIEALMETEGYQVRHAEDGEAALEAVQAERPTLVLLDVTLPKLDGWQVLARLRAQPCPPPVVLLTGQARAARRAEAAGAVAAVLKPFDIEELLRLVASLLRQQATGNRQQ